MMAVFDATQPIKGQEAPVCTQHGRFDEQSPDLRCGAVAVITAIGVAFHWINQFVADSDKERLKR